MSTLADRIRAVRETDRHDRFMGLMLGVVLACEASGYDPNREQLKEICRKLREQFTAEELAQARLWASREGVYDLFS